MEEVFNKDEYWLGTKRLALKTFFSNKFYKSSKQNKTLLK